MKSKILKIAFGCVFALGMNAFVACSSESSGRSHGADKEPSDVADLELANGKSVVCDDDMEGVVAIAADDGYRKCVNGEWVKITRREALKADEIIGQVEDDDEKNESSGSTMEYSVETNDDIPTCTAKREGSTVLVEDTGKQYVCEDGEWIALQSSAKSSSSVKSGNSSSSDVTGSEGNSSAWDMTPPPPPGY